MFARLAATFATMSNDCRHGVYVWWLTGAVLSGIMVITMTKTGSVAEHAVDALSSILTILVATYLGVEAVTRSSILTKIGQRISPADVPDPPTSTTTTVAQTTTTSGT